MKARVLYFAMLKEKMKSSGEECAIQEGETVRDLARRLFRDICEERFLQNSLMYGVNNSYVPADYSIQDGDEIAFIPPVAGG